MRGWGAFNGRGPGNGLLVAAEGLIALLSEEGGSKGQLLGAGEETETEAGGHYRRRGC